MRMSHTDTGSVVCMYMCKPCASCSISLHSFSHVLAQFLTSDDAPLRGTMIWLMVRVVLVLQESESDTSDLGLSYSV